MAKSRVEKAPVLDISKDLNEIFDYIDNCDVTDDQGRYLHWSKFKWRVSDKQNAKKIWKAVKFKRFSQYKKIGIKDEHGQPFVYCTPHSMEATLYQLVKVLGGNVDAVADSPAGSSLQDMYLVSSLMMEEAITSAQLEGASTTREIAKKMLEDERDPVDEDERMILNNYLLLKQAEHFSKQDLSIDMILEFHRIATKGTTENNVIPGELRNSNDIYVEDGDGVAHHPPNFELLVDRLQSLCDFANQDHSGQNGCDFVHPLIKAITLHFMIGYEHPFRDGNGRTARALFYWFMLKSDYTLFKYISISKLLKEKPKDYGLSYMYTEDDGNDLTYFIYFQLEIITDAFEELKKYLDQKANEFKRISETLDKTSWGNSLNFIQKDLIKKAVKEPGRIFTAKEVANSYSISENTSRAHLNKLVSLKLFFSTKNGRTTLYIAPSELVSKLKVSK